MDIEVQSKFIAELQDLLMKYKVHRAIEDCGDGYYPDPYITFWAFPQYDDNGILIAEHIDYRTKEMGW
jgi:hypothetical protein